MTAARGAATKVSSGGDLATPIGIAAESNRSIVVADADAFGGKGGVIRIDAVTGKQTALSSAGLFSNPFALVVESTGAILVADPHAAGAGGVIRVDPKTGEQSMLSSGQEQGATPPLREIGIALEANGSIIVVEQSLAGGAQGNGRVSRINAKTGARKVLSSGGEFSSPAGVVVDGKGSILVVDTDAFGGSGGVIRINPRSGKQTKVSSGSGFTGPRGVAVVPAQTA
jgi:DNA-binding beta-propeller fold protein YncE